MPDYSLFGDEHVRRYEATGGKIGHDWNNTSCLVLHTIGRKSGETKKFPALNTDSRNETCVVLATSSIASECRRRLRRERATLKMNEHDAIALLAIDSDEPELGAAFFPVALRRDFAIAGQDCNRTVDSNLFIRQLY